MAYRWLAAVLIGAIAIGAASCGRGTPPAGPAPGLRFVATTGMVADAVRRVAGDRASVRALMGEGVDPHLYKASPGDLRLLSEADAVFYNGLHLEGKLSDALESLAAKKPVFALADAIPEEQLRHPLPGSTTHDPHVWFDVALWIHVVEGARQAISKVDPAGAAAYESNAREYTEELRALDALCREQTATIPAEQRVLVTAHDAFGYFGRAYGLEVLAIQGISTEHEASLRELNGLVETIATRKIPAVFFESSVPRKAIDALVEGCAARGHTLRIGGELFSDALGKDGTPEGTYVGMVRHNVTTIVRSLRGESP